jgi:hypothetical protein
MNSTQRIRELNDELRQHLLGGLAVMTPGVRRATVMGPASANLHNSRLLHRKKRPSPQSTWITQQSGNPSSKRSLAFFSTMRNR